MILDDKLFIYVITPLAVVFFLYLLFLEFRIYCIRKNKKRLESEFKRILKEVLMEVFYE